MDGIIFVGNPPMYPSGYGKQLALIQKHLAGKYFMAHICDFGYDGPAFEYNGVTVYGVAEHPGVLTTKHIDKCISNFLGAHPIDKWIIIGLGNLYNRGILENYPSLLLSVVETSELTSNELHSISTSIPVAISSFGQESSTHMASSVISWSPMLSIHRSSQANQVVPYDPQRIGLSLQRKDSWSVSSGTSLFGKALSCCLKFGQLSPKARMTPTSGFITRTTRTWIT